jgi:hypothetical protein
MSQPQKTGLLLFLYNCASRKEENSNYPQIQPLVSKAERKGILKLELKSKENIPIKNFTLRISKNFPKTKHESSVTGGSFPFPFLFESNLLAYVRIHDFEYSMKVDLKANEIYDIVIPEGEYYASIDTVENDALSFSPLNSPRILFTFGYQHKQNNVRGKISEYDLECVSYYTGDNEPNTIWNSSACPKLIIKENKITKIQISDSSRKVAKGFILFAKMVGGIILLSPFTNLNGTFFYRDYLVELINNADPILDNKK